MAFSNLVFILAAMGYFWGTLRLYFLGLKLRRYFYFAAIFFIAITATYWWTRPNLGLQLFLVCGGIFHFCSGVRNRRNWFYHFGGTILLMALLIYFGKQYISGTLAVTESWRANFNRMIFNFPFERVGDASASKGTGNGAFPNSAIFFLAILCAYPWIKNFQKIPMELKVVVGISWAWLLARSLFYAEMDATILVIPGFMLMICYTLSFTFD